MSWLDIINVLKIIVIIYIYILYSSDEWIYPLTMFNNYTTDIFYILYHITPTACPGKMLRGSLAVQQANSKESGVIVGLCWKNHENR